MDNLSKIAYRAVIFSSRQPSWWLLALLQAAAFSVIGNLARPEMSSSLDYAWMLSAVVILSPLTIWLWQNIESTRVPPVKTTPIPGVAPGDAGSSQKKFLKQSLDGAALVLFAAVLIILSHLFLPFWPLHTLVFAVAAATAGLALLYVALCDQNFVSALGLAMDTWNKRISFAAAAALVLLLAHGISFFLAHDVWENVYIFQQFSVFGHSATIWVLFILLLGLIAYFSAVLNCFVVFLFLDIINRKKDPEAEKAKAVQPVRVGAT